MFKSKVGMVLQCGLLSLVVVPLWAQPVTNDVSPNAVPGAGPSAFGDQICLIDATATTGHVCLLGVEFAQGSYWVTSGGQPSCDPGGGNFLFQLDLNGNVQNSWPQPNADTFGWRDLAYDGTFLYTSTSGVIEEVNPATGTPTGVTIPCPTSPCRALAYDPVTDHFWVANFSSSIWEIDRAGAIQNTFANALTIYGLAWDTSSPGGPFLWAWSQDGPVGQQVTATQIDPNTGVPTGTSFLGSVLPGANVAGGATFVPPGANPNFPLIAALVGMHQADADTIGCYELVEIPVELMEFEAQPE